MSRQQLVQSVQFIQDIQEGSVDGGYSSTQTVYGYRTLLFNLVENFLTSINKVSESLEKNGEGSECYMLFRWSQYCMKECPDTFVAPPPGHGDTTPTLTQLKEGQLSDEEELAHGFSRWFLFRVVRLLGYASCKDLHLKCLDAIHQLFRTIRSREAYCYASLLKEIILALGDLVQINDVMYKEEEDVPRRLERFLVPPDTILKSLQEPAKRSQENTDLQPSTVNIDIPDVDVCDLLMLNLTKLLCHEAGDILFYCAAQLPGVWGIMSYHIHHGDAELKTESLKVVTVLLEHFECPPLRVMDYFLACMVALLELLCSGCKGTPKEQVRDLEAAAAATFYAMISRNQLEDRKLFSSANLQYILTRLAEILRDKGLSSLQTDDLHHSISRLIIHIEDSLPPSILLGKAFKPSRSQVVAALLCEIGYSNTVQYLVGALVKCIQTELQSSLLSSLMIGQVEMIEIDGEEAEDRMSEKVDKRALANSKKKRKLDEEPIRKKVTRYSRTVRLLVDKLDSLSSQQLTEETSMKVLEGCHAVIEILTTSLSLCTSGRMPEDLRHLHAWVSLPQFQALCDLWVKVMQSSGTWETETINRAYRIIVHTIGALLSVQETAEYNLDLYQTYTWLLSLPWLPNDLSWLDFKPNNPREIMNIAGALVEKLETGSLCESLQVLSFLPKDVASKWRTHIFRQALTDSSTEERKSAVLAFPVLLQNLGPNANHLVYDLIHPCLQDKAQDVQEALVEMSGTLACVISRKTVLNRQVDLSNSVMLQKSVQIVCASCDAWVERVDGSNSPRERPRIVDPNMFSSFLQFVDSENTSIKRKLIPSLKRMFGHFGVRSSNSATMSCLTTSLKLLEDPDYQIRGEFSKIIHYLLGYPSNETSDGANQLVLGKLREVFTTAQNGGNKQLQETVLLTVAHLGRVAEGNLLIVIIIHLLESLLSHIPLVAAVAYEQLQGIARHKKCKTQNLFINSRQAICKFLVETMHDAQTKQTGKSAEDILLAVVKVLDFPDVKTFLTGTEKYIVPQLVSKGTQAASSLIKLIATQLSIPSRKKLLITNTKYVFSYLVRYCQKESDLQNSIHYLQKETEFELKNLLRIDFQRVHNELLLHLSSDYSQVFKGLRILSTYEVNYTGPSISTSEEMADYLQPRLLGVLVFFESQLQNYNVPMEEKRFKSDECGLPLDRRLCQLLLLFVPSQHICSEPLRFPISFMLFLKYECPKDFSHLKALESLISIIKLMGSKYISAIRHKVMNTLRIGLQFTDREFVEISCRAWNCFVRSLELPFLGQMMPQIVATLLPLLERLPKQVADIFNFMIVENRVPLQGYFHDIYFLPDMLELSDANVILKQYTEGPSSQTDFSTRLVHSIKGITHETLDVRLHALSKLKKLLREEREAFFQSVIGNETADPVVSQLVSVLLKGCREQDPRVQSLYSECLGELGAVDPGRLELSANNPKEEMARFHSSIEEDNFVVGLINELVKAYLAATEPRIQDCSAYALQELLQVYQVSETNEADPSGSKLWKRFSEQTQEILIPLTTSKYMLAVKSDWTSLQRPIYCSKKGNNYKDWVSTWTGYLSSKVKQEKAHRVFKSCSAAIKHELNVALCILSHIVLLVLLDGSQEDVEEIRVEIMEVLHQVKRSDAKQRSGSDFHRMSAQIVFSVLDYLTRWKTLRAQMKAAEAPAQSKGVGPSYLSDQGYMAVDNFLKQVPEDVLADACYICQAFTRSLMHFEQYVVGKTQYLQDHLDFMQRLYVAMDEPDGVLGVAAIRQLQPTLMEQILTHESLGQQQEVQACYEQAIQSDSDNLSYHQGLLRSLMDLGQQSKSLLHATGVIAEKPGWVSQLNAYRVEAAWKLGNWDKLETYIRPEQDSRNWAIGLGKVLLLAKEKKGEQFLKQLEIVRREQMGPLSAASMEMGSYQRGYEYIVRLMMLTEVEETARVLMRLGGVADDTEPRIAPTDLLSQWQTRMQITQSSFRTQEPVLTLRRTLLTLVQHSGESILDREIGQCWLGSAKIARNHWSENGRRHVGSSPSKVTCTMPTATITSAELKEQGAAEVPPPSSSQMLLELQMHRLVQEVTTQLLNSGAGYLQTAFSALLQANDHNLPEFCLQKAKWLWEKGDFDQALSCLERQMQVHFKDSDKLKLDNTEEGKALRRVCAEALLLYGRYSEDTANMESNAIVKQYRDVIDVLPDWEDGHFYLAKYYDKIMTTLLEDKDRSDITRQGEFIVYVVKSFGQSLQYGNQYIYQSMPRMLSLWFDFGSGVVEYEKKEKTKPTQSSGQALQKVRLTLNKLNKIIASIGKALATYQWFTAFPQLISRICHASADVFEQLKAIIARTMVTFPQQALWMLMAVSKSSYPMRVKRCQEIFSSAKTMEPSLNKLVQDATKLTERLLELCEKDFPNQLNISVTQHFRPLKRLLDDSNFGPILLPLQSAMTVTLPNKTNNQANRNPFPNDMVYIQGLEDTIEILPSLQRPKKITLTGSDGRLYVMMCKPKDDLRKDSRLMEFNGIVNKFLRKDPESRRRQLHIRTYTVIPLNEECGLIEWVNNTNGLRNILLKLYKEKGLYTSGRELKAMAPAHGSSLDIKLQIFKQKLLPRHPSVFREWFLRTFPDPTSWYNARLAYARTSAVISMVGYILGLGDRHGENILFDSTSGDSLHVDFNCLFNKGETFEWPEKVPFRLTHNMIDAMGPMGFEGIFRLACEVTLRVMRDQMDPLMSVLKPFIYDPLVEWSKPPKGQRSNPTDSGEISNEQAMTHVQNIELRLKGIMKNKTKPRGLALSVEGHVNYLIQESTDEKNLCQMYIGWAAYL